jgi:hypothetical protein
MRSSSGSRRMATSTRLSMESCVSAPLASDTSASLRAYPPPRAVCRGEAPRRCPRIQPALCSSQRQQARSGRESRGRGEARAVPEGSLPKAPDLAVEVISPGDPARQVLDRVGEYLQAGVRLVWVIEPEGRTATIYRTLTDVRTVSESASSIAVHASCGVRQTSAGVSTLHVLNFRPSWP